MADSFFGFDTTLGVSTNFSSHNGVWLNNRKRKNYANSGKTRGRESFTINSRVAAYL